MARRYKAPVIDREHIRSDHIVVGKQYPFHLIPWSNVFSGGVQ